MKKKKKYMCHNHPPQKPLKNYTKWYNQKLNNSKGSKKGETEEWKLEGKFRKQIVKWQT